MISVKLAEVGDGIFKIPPARVWHSAKDHVIGEKVETYRRDLRRIRRRSLIWLRRLQIERVPVKMAAGKIRRVQQQVFFRHRRPKSKVVLQSLRLPRCILCGLSE